MQWHIIYNTVTLIHENFGCKIAAISFVHQCVKHSLYTVLVAVCYQGSTWRPELNAVSINIPVVIAMAVSALKQRKGTGHPSTAYTYKRTK